MSRAKTLKVYLDQTKGKAIELQIPVEKLGAHGILKYQDKYYVFSYFVHGEAAVQFVEADVLDLNN